MAIKNLTLSNNEAFNEFSLLLELDDVLLKTSNLNDQLIGLYKIVGDDDFDLVLNKVCAISGVETNDESKINSFKEEFHLDFLKPMIVAKIKVFISSETISYSHKSISRNNVKYIVGDEVINSSFPYSITSSNAGYECVYVVENNINGIILSHNEKLIELEYLDLSTKVINEIINCSANLSSSINQHAVIYNDVIGGIQSIIDSKNSECNSITKSIELSLFEKSRIEESNRKTSEIFDRVSEDVNDSSRILERLQASIKEISLVEKVNRDKLNSLKNEINDNVKKAEDYKVNTSSAEEKLTALNSQLADAEKNLNLYTFDMQGFDKESKFQLNKYYIGVAALLSMLFTIFGFMYFSAKSFSELIDTSWKVSTWDILLSRLPLFTATALIIGTFSALLFFLVNHIISLNSDKMNMLKASILAEQITGTLGCELTMTPEQVVDLKRNTKIELLVKVFSPKENTKISSASEQVDVLAKLLEILKPKS